MKKLIIPVLILALFGSLPLYAGWLLEPDGETATKASNSAPVAATVLPKSNIAVAAPKPAVQTNKPVPVVQPPVKYEVALINLKKSEGGTVTVSWQNPASIQGYSLKVYRDTSVLDAPEKIIDSKMIAKLDPPAASYVDKPVSVGKYFYAVTVTYNGTEFKSLTPDVSFTSFGVNIAPVVAAVAPVLPPPPVVPSPIAGLSASVQKNGEISLSWNLSTDTNIRYNIYRANTPMRSSDDITTKLKSVKGKFSENITEPGSYYYAVTVENIAGENKKILFGTNSLSAAVVVAPKPIEVVKIPEPVKIQEPVKVQPAVTIKTEIQVVLPHAKEVKSAIVPSNVVETKPYDDILLEVKRGSYYEEHYQEALVALKSLANDENCPLEVRNEAELFIGKCYYQLGRYSEAIKSLIKVKNIFPEEADFWIGRSADKL